MSLARFIHLRCVTRVCNEGVPRGVCNEGCVTSQLVLLQRSVTRSATNVRRGSVTDPSKEFTAIYMIYIYIHVFIPCIWHIYIHIHLPTQACICRFGSRQVPQAFYNFGGSPERATAPILCVFLCHSKTSPGCVPVVFLLHSSKGNQQIGGP